jgi:hypothetical protein
MPAVGFISGAALLQLPGAALLQLPGTALLQLPGAALLQLPGAALLQLPGAALLQLPGLNAASSCGPDRPWILLLGADEKGNGRFCSSIWALTLKVRPALTMMVCIFDAQDLPAWIDGSPLACHGYDLQLRCAVYRDTVKSALIIQSGIHCCKNLYLLALSPLICLFRSETSSISCVMEDYASRDWYARSRPLA